MPYREIQTVSCKLTDAHWVNSCVVIWATRTTSSLTQNWFKRFNQKYGCDLHMSKPHFVQCKTCISGPLPVKLTIFHDLQRQEDAYFVKSIKEIYLIKPLQDVVVVWENITVNAKCVVKESNNGNSSKEIIPAVVVSACSIDDV